MDDKGVPSTEEMLDATNDALRHSKSQNSKILKCHSEVCGNVQNEESLQNVTDYENIPAICIETSDEDDASKRLPTDVERTENQFQFMTDLDSSIDCGNELAYCISAVKICNNVEKNVLDFLHKLTIDFPVS